MQNSITVLVCVIFQMSKWRIMCILKPLSYFCVFAILDNRLPLSLAVQTNSNPINYNHIPNLKDKVYKQLGDINIGFVADVSRWVSGGQECQRDIADRSNIPEDILPVKFAVDLVNSDPSLLPNVTFGFVMRGACRTIAMKLVTSLSFIPRSERFCNSSGDCFIQPMNSQTNSDYVTHDVIGMLAPDTSAETITLSNLMTVASLPMMGFIAGSNDLDDKQMHPYFFRVNTQNVYQVKAILKFIQGNGWTYIQMIYRDVDTGRDAYKFMHRYAESYGICIAESYILVNYKEVATSLLQNRKARVVVFFAAGWRWIELVREIHGQNGSYHFIWIVSSVFGSYSGYYYSGLPRDPGKGIFTVYPFTTVIPEYYDLVRNIDIMTTKIPWLRPTWERILFCSYSKGTCKPNVDILKYYRFIRKECTSLKVDAVLAFAHAAHDLLQDRCPDARGKEATACITGDLIREYLKKVKFRGYSGEIEFNENQSVLGAFIVRQTKYGITNSIFVPKNYKSFFQKPLAIYQSGIDSITYLKGNISWSHLNPVERIVPRTKDSLFNDVPESVCSRPCVVGEYKIEKDLPCCWDCLKCRDNERLTEGNNVCEACPIFTWPDPMSNFTTCIDIPLTYQTMQNTIPIVLISIAAFAIILTIFIFSVYMKYRNERVVKASSRELSVIQLVGIFTGYTTVILFQTKPTHTMCRTIFFLFCMSFALLYCPLLVKTIRIVRIFKSAAKNKPPKFISPRSQLIVAISLITVQILLCGTVFILFMPGAHRTQPIRIEKMVELSCDFTLPGLSSFLGYNICLVCLCSIFAFMVRKLPDNYNESNFISMCVSTTLLIWMAFIPTYFTAGKEYIRMLLLCMALILNHSVALTLLFLPKLYAAKFVADGALNFAMKK